MFLLIHMAKNEMQLIEVDILRTFAIFSVIITHYSFYNLSFFEVLYSYRLYLVLIGVTGVAVFFFLAGYLSYHKYKRIDSVNDFRHFYNRKLLRIYPLYLLFLLIVLVDYANFTDYSFFNILAHLCGLHVLLSPAFIQSYIGVSWFIGVIFLYYFIYPFLVHFSDSGEKIIFNSCILFFILLSIRIIFNMIDLMFFEYYFIFILGIIASQGRLFERREFKYSLPFAFFFLIVSIILYPKVVQVDFLNMAMNFSLEYLSGVIIVLGIRSVIFISIISIIVWFSRNYSNIVSTKIGQICNYCAFGSYCVYLFHLSFFSTILEILNKFNIYGIFHDLILIFLGIPLLFVICYQIQYLEILVVNSIRSRL